VSTGLVVAVQDKGYHEQHCAIVRFGGDECDCQQEVRLIREVAELKKRLRDLEGEK
jgi:hypothetical protein